MSFNKGNDDLLKEAFSKALEEEIAEIPDVGDNHEFSPQFSSQMEALVEKSKTVKFKLSAPRAQRYIAAAIAAVFMISTFTVAAKIAPPKTDKAESNATLQSKNESEESSHKKGTSSSATSTVPENSGVAHQKGNTVSGTSGHKETSSIETIEPWDGNEETEDISSTIYAEGYVATFESVFQAESDTAYIFRSNDRLYNRWNDLTLCGLVDSATQISIELDKFALTYLAVPLSDYPYSDAITGLKGDTLGLKTEGLDNCSIFAVNYREDMQYLILETESQSYLAKYLRCDNDISFQRVLEQVYGVINADSISRTAILNVNGEVSSKHTLTSEEIETLYSILSKATLTAEPSVETGEIIKKLIITTEQGGTIHIFYHDSGRITVVDQQLGNYTTLSAEDIQVFEKLLDIAEETSVSSALTSSTDSQNSSIAEGIDSSTSTVSDSTTSPQTSSQETTSQFSTASQPYESSVNSNEEVTSSTVSKISQ